MKLLYLALPLMGSLAIAQSLIEDDCQCPQVRCPSSDTFEGCVCTNFAEMRCKLRCPSYKPTKFNLCTLPMKSTTRATTLATPTLPILGFPTPALPTPDLPTPALPSNPVLSDTPPIPGCECEETFCIQSYPDSCHCAYNAAKTCWNKCGGPSPGLNTCPPLGSGPSDGPVKRKNPTVPIPSTGVAAVVSTAGAVASSPTEKCECEQRFCIQSFPAGCICANAGKRACWKKCGGVKPTFQNCSSPATIPESAPESTKVQICGGGRASTNFCPSGYTCINDPYKSGCGLECDGTGICVKEKLCGGFAGFECDGQGQVCVDDPRDDCSRANGGADCGGLCVWPPALRTT